MRFRRMTALLLALVMALSLAACQGGTNGGSTFPPETEPSTTETTAPPTTEPIPTEPADLYAAAVEELLASPGLVLHVETERALTLRGETFEEHSEQDICYNNYGTDSFAASVTETVQMDTYQTEYEERFESGTVYLTVDGTSLFKGAMSAEDYISRYAPVVMLDASLYGEIAQTADGFSFSAPTAGESWIVPDYAELVEASGTALLNVGGKLTGFTYDVTYTIGGASVSYQIEMTVQAADALELSPLPEDSEAVELEYVDAPRFIEQAAGYLWQADVNHSVTTTIAESIISYAGGVVRNQSNTINFWGSGDSYMGDVDLSLYIMSAQETFSYEQVEHFQDGVYTYSTDGGEPTTADGVTAAVFQNYCANALLGNILSYELLASATAEDLGSLYFLELTGNSDLSESLNQYACSTLWGDENFLNDLAESFETTTMEVYLAVDKFTGLPTAVGYYFEGNHTIEGVDYLLSVQVDQSFDLASDSAYETLTEEAPPVEEPEVKATPVFYHVTGENGQEMWLLGTIHIGDERTSYLPQEIYDAFDAADALAVEFNSEAFSEALENDEELSDQVSDCYFYSDGTTTGDHIEDEELFEYAEKLVKATGNYHMNAPYLRAYLWSSSIDNFYLRQSYDLSSTQGVDNQLIWRAEEQGKEIRDVESGLFQVEMLMGFSDGLQEELLYEAVCTDPYAYVADTRELFEMWCAGDEAALIAYLTEEPDYSDMTEEEIALIEEYNNAMGTDRNDDMHDVAVGYLESGDVVFYAVGLAHLLAEDGLVNTLRAAGYTVELVTYE